MSMCIGNKKNKKMWLGDKKIKKIYQGNLKIYSSGEIVTYRVNPNQNYYEEVEEGKTVLNPTTFTPALTGWTHLGWRKDAVATATVLTALLMADDPITLYAVFRQTANLSYNGNGSTGGSTATQSGYRYTNNGNYSNPSFSLRASGFTRSYYAFCGWMLGSTRYQPGASVSLAGSSTAYAMWRAASLVLSTTDRCTPVTGGWKTRIDWGAEQDTDYQGTVGAIVGGTGGRINLYTKIPVDFTYISRISINIETGYCGGHFYAGISSDPYADGVEAGIDMDYKLEGMVRQEVDVSGITGSKYFKVVMYPNNHCSVIVENITCT